MMEIDDEFLSMKVTVGDKTYTIRRMLRDAEFGYYSYHHFVRLVEMFYQVCRMHGGDA